MRALITAIMFILFFVVGYLTLMGGVYLLATDITFAELKVVPIMVIASFGFGLFVACFSISDFVRKMNWMDLFD